MTCPLAVHGPSRTTLCGPARATGAHRDFYINGKKNVGNDRVIHHYAGALNAIPVSEHFLK